MRQSSHDSHGLSLGGEIKYKATDLNFVPKFLNLKNKDLLSYTVMYAYFTLIDLAFIAKWTV